MVALGYPRISRTVDYSDLGAFIVLPLAWRAAPRLGRLQIITSRVRRLAIVPVLLTSGFAVAATSPPTPESYLDQWAFRVTGASPALRRPEVSAAVEAVVEKYGLEA